MQSRKRQVHSALRRHKQDCKFNNSLGASGQLGVDSRAFKCMCVGGGREGGSGEGEKKGALSICMVRATNLAEALGLNCSSQLWTREPNKTFSMKELSRAQCGQMA